MDKRLLSIIEAAAYIGVSPNKARDYLRDCKIKIGRRSLYDIRRIDEKLNKAH